MFRAFATAGLVTLLSALTAAAQVPNFYGNSYGGGSGGGGYGGGGYGGGGYGGGYGNPFGGGAGPFMQNYYNRNTQPLSPYLNLFRGTNPAVNYFYGVRPGTMAGGAFGSPFGGNRSMLGRQTFFPEVDNLYDLENVSKLDGMPPTGHPIGFSNTLNYYGGGSGYGMMGMRNQQRPAFSPTRSGGSTGVR